MLVVFKVFLRRQLIAIALRNVVVITVEFCVHLRTLVVVVHGHLTATRYNISIRQCMREAMRLIS